MKEESWTAGLFYVCTYPCLLEAKDYSKDPHKAEYMGPGFTESAAGQMGVN